MESSKISVLVNLTSTPNQTCHILEKPVLIESFEPLMPESSKPPKYPGSNPENFEDQMTILMDLMKIETEIDELKNRIEKMIEEKDVISYTCETKIPESVKPPIPPKKFDIQRSSILETKLPSQPKLSPISDSTNKPMVPPKPPISSSTTQVLHSEEIQSSIHENSPQSNNLKESKLIVQKIFSNYIENI